MDHDPPGSSAHGILQARILDMTLSKFQEMVKDRAAWRAVVQGMAKSWTQLSDLATTGTEVPHVLWHSQKQKPAKDPQMANRHMKRGSTLLIIREMQTKATVRYHPHQSEGPSSKSPKLTNAREGREKEKRSCTVGGNVNWCSYGGEQYGGFFSFFLIN